MAEHEEGCVHPRKTGEEIIGALDIMDAKQADDEKMFKDIFSLLSFEKITFNGELTV